MTDWTPEQQKEHLRMLADALIVSPYRQTTGVLKEFNPVGDDPDSPYYCAVGLACELSELGSWEMAEGHGCLYYLIPDTPEDKQSLYMPEAVRHFYGFTLYMEARLLEMNDDEAHDFEEIGLWLETELDGFIAD